MGLTPWELELYTPSELRLLLRYADSKIAQLEAMSDG